MRGRGGGESEEKGGNNSRTDVKRWNETSRRGGWGGGNQKVRDGDNAAAEEGSEATENSREGQKNVSWELSDELSGAIKKKDEEDGWVDQTRQPVREIYHNRETSQGERRSKCWQKTKPNKQPWCKQTVQTSRPAKAFAFLSEHSDGSTFRGSIILESNHTILQPDASRPPCCCWCHDPG